VFLSLLLVSGCASLKGSEPPREQSGFLKGYYERLAPVPDGDQRMRWIRPGVDFSRYRRVMVESVVFYLAEASEYKGIDSVEMNDLTEAFNLALVNALKDRYPIVSEPAPDVLRIRVAITELERSRPGLSTVTTVVPVGLGISIVKKGATDAWTGSGKTGVELMGIDSLSNEVIVAGKDRRSAGFTERFSTWGAAKEDFQFWAGRIRAFLDSEHAAPGAGKGG
jgi:hypothetical protein